MIRPAGTRLGLAKHVMTRRRTGSRMSLWYGHCSCGIETPRHLTRQNLDDNGPNEHQRMHPNGAAATFDN